MEVAIPGQQHQQPHSFSRREAVVCNQWLDERRFGHPVERGSPAEPSQRTHSNRLVSQFAELQRGWQIHLRGEWKVADWPEPQVLLWPDQRKTKSVQRQQS